jgi:hypothetical protein
MARPLPIGNRRQQVRHGSRVSLPWAEDHAARVASAEIGSTGLSSAPAMRSGARTGGTAADPHSSVRQP